MHNNHLPLFVNILIFKFQVDLWKKFIAFEKSNPLRTEDTALITRRVMFATEQCLLVLTHHPAVWHQAAQYLDQSAQALAEKGVRIVLHKRIIIFFKFNSWRKGFTSLLRLQLIFRRVLCYLLTLWSCITTVCVAPNNLLQCLLVLKRNLAGKAANKTLCYAHSAQHIIDTNATIDFFYFELL